MTLTRYVFVALVVAFLAWLLIAVRGLADTMPADPADVTPTTSVPAAAFVGPSAATELELAALRARVQREQAKAKREHARYLAAHRRARQLTRTLAHTPSTREAIDLACNVYGSCSTLWRRASCESGYYRFAKNPSGASGLFQFLPSTWETTPFARFSIWSPYAQALAAGWMQARGRGGEWVCQ